MSESYYVVYSEESKKVYWFMRKEKADRANLFAIRQYVKNHKESLSAEEILLRVQDAVSVKSLLINDSSAALALIKKENPDEILIEYPDDLKHKD